MQHEQPAPAEPAATDTDAGAQGEPAKRRWWNLLDVAFTDGGSELSLWQRDDLFVIKVDDLELMSSRVHGSEEAMARYGCKHVAKAAKPRVLVGGLGLGYTAAATLKRVPKGGEVVVVERVPAVVEWNRKMLGHLAGHPLDDPRLDVRVDDVADVLRRERGYYDAILLDVDNGPNSLSLASNKSLYTWRGVRMTLEALREDGVLVIWSAGPDHGFRAQLRRMGLDHRTQIVGERGGKRGRKHFLHIVRT